MQKNSGEDVEKLVLPLLEKGVDNVPLLLHIFLAFFKPVILALNIDNSGVIQYPGLLFPMHGLLMAVLLSSFAFVIKKIKNN